MSTQEIPREEWTNFFDSFSRQHQGWLATLEVLGSDIGAQQEADQLPFEGISLSSDDEEAAVLINVGKSVDHVSHSIRQPKHVWLQRTPEGANESIEIEAEGDSKTLLRFRSPMLSEFVDGVVLEQGQ